MESLLKKKKKKEDIPTNQMDHKIHGVNEDEKTDPEGVSGSKNHQFLHDN